MSAAVAACYKDVCAFIDKSLSRSGLVTHPAPDSADVWIGRPPVHPGPIFMVRQQKTKGHAGIAPHGLCETVPLGPPEIRLGAHSVRVEAPV
jgi:hypothetical protein